MAKSRHGCAMVTEGGEVIGLFRTTDALRVLAEVATTNGRAGDGELDTPRARPKRR